MRFCLGLPPQNGQTANRRFSVGPRKHWFQWHSGNRKYFSSFCPDDTPYFQGWGITLPSNERVRRPRNFKTAFMYPCVMVLSLAVSREVKSIFCIWHTSVRYAGCANRRHEGSHTPWQERCLQHTHHNIYSLEKTFVTAMGELTTFTWEGITWSAQTAVM